MWRFVPAEGGNSGLTAEKESKFGGYYGNSRLVAPQEKKFWDDHWLQNNY